MDKKLDQGLGKHMYTYVYWSIKHMPLTDQRKVAMNTKNEHVNISSSVFIFNLAKTPKIISICTLY